MKSPFNLRQFLIDHRLTPQELAAAMEMSIAAIYVIMKRGTAKTTFIRDLEKKYGDCSQYLQESCEQTTVLVAE